jgi:uncharacterized FAD-dependent dehydrogenase
MRNYQNAIRGWHNMINNSTPAESRIKTPTPSLEQPPVEQQVEEIIQPIYKKIVIVGAGVAGINAATKLVDNGYDGSLITIIDKGNDPHNRLPEEVMTGMLGAGGWSDGKLTYHTEIGGQLSKYCGEEKAMELMDQVISNFRRFHPKPEEIFMSDPQEEPEFIKPYFGLRMFPVWHIGSNFLHEIAKTWYQYLLDKGIRFEWNTTVINIDFQKQDITTVCENPKLAEYYNYDELIFAVGKSGIDFAQHLSNLYELPTEPKSVQIGVRFEAPQKYFQKLIDISYDFKLYQKFDNVSLRTFCTNNNAAYVAVEETYGNVTYNGHAKKGEQYRNDMTNFGILMEIKGIDNPFEWSRDVVQKLQAGLTNTDNPVDFKTTGLYFSPARTRTPAFTSEGTTVSAVQIDYLDVARETMGKYFNYIEDFINDMNKVFNFGDDWGIYIPEVKYLSPEPLVNYTDLSLNEYPNVHFVGDALSARGITVSGAHGIYVAESLIK